MCVYVCVFSLVSLPLGPSSHHRSERQTDDGLETKPSQQRAVFELYMWAKGTLTFSFLLQWRQCCFSLRHTQRQSYPNICNHKYLKMRFKCAAELRNLANIIQTYLFYCCPVFKYVNVSQHVDNERSCDTEKRFYTALLQSPHYNLCNTRHSRRLNVMMRWMMIRIH